MLAERAIFLSAAESGKEGSAVEEIRLYCRGQPRGTVTLDRGDSRREVEAAMADPGDGLYRAFLVGEKGELPLGVMEPDRGRLTARRRIYARDVAALGPLRRGEARMSFRFGESVWQEVRDPGQLVSVPELRQRLEKVPRAFRRREGERLLLAFPVEEGKPFPLETMFCLARVLPVEGRLCAVYAFDREGRPLPP